jgi:hypothetical protein
VKKLFSTLQAHPPHTHPQTQETTQETPAHLRNTEKIQILVHQLQLPVQFLR